MAHCCPADRCRASRVRRALLPALAVLAAAGCSRSAAPPSETVADIAASVPGPTAPAATTTDEKPSFAAQVAAVREGRATAIVAAEPPTPEEWESLRGLPALATLVLERGRADDRAAGIIATLPAIERVVLRESPLTDTGFARLAECRSLRDVNVPQADCTAAGIRALVSLENLRALRLGGKRLAGPEVGEAVATLPRLRSLHLIDVPLGDRGLAALRGLPGLWSLYLDGAGVSDEAWAEYFRECPGVHVHVDQAHHDRDPRGHHD